MHERIIFEKIKPGDVPGYRSVNMDREECAAKVGAGGTAAPGALRKSLRQSVREGDFKESDSGSPEAGEVSAWLFEEWEKARKRDQAALAMERRRQAAW